MERKESPLLFRDIGWTGVARLMENVNLRSQAYGVPNSIPAPVNDVFVR